MIHTRSKSGLYLPPRELVRAYSDADYERWINNRRAPFQPPLLPLVRRAITSNAQIRNSSATNASSYNTASITSTANRLQIVATLGAAVTAASIADPTGISGAGLTLAKIVSRNNTPGGINLSFWRAMGTAAGSGALTISWPTTMTFCIWSVFELIGVELGSNGANAVNSNTNSNLDNTASTNTISTSLAAFGSAINGAIAALSWFNVSGTVPTCTPRAGWSEVDDNGTLDGATAAAQETQFRATNDTTQSGTWTANGALMIISAEIIADTRVPYQPWYQRGPLLAR